MATTPKQRLVHSALSFLGSLTLAMILLAVIIVACAVGTVAESRFDTAIAQAYVYDAPWFIAWLLLLCVNLICAVLVRYPWKPHHTGFIVTHAGIVVLLGGAMIGRIWGIEGSMTLVKGGRPASDLALNQTVFDVHASSLGKSRSRILHLGIRPPAASHPERLDLNGIQIALVDYAKELGIQTRVEKAAADGTPAVHVILRSEMMPRPMSQWLRLADAKRDTLNAGPVQIRFASTGSTEASHAAIPASIDSHAHGHATTELREKHFVFAKMPDMTMARVLSGQPTGIKAAFRFDPAAQAEKDTQGILALEIGPQRSDFSVKEILESEVPVPGTAWTLKRLRFLPDFRMEGKEPVSASSAPNNPALVFEITGKSSAADKGASPECDEKEGECDHTQQKACCPAPGEKKATPHGAVPPFQLTLFRDPGGKLTFAKAVNGRTTAEGKVEFGKEISLDAADWRILVDDFSESVAIRDELVPFSLSTGITSAAGASAKGLASSQPIMDRIQPIRASGVLVHVKRNGQDIRQWVASGQPTELALGDETLRFSFGQRVLPLDFKVALDDFEVERDEGTQTPAGFKSHVRFIDSRNHSELKREVWMNHPADYPDFPGVSLLGTAYKFSQASWNPNDLAQTTLQVVRDPGWSLKWIGSLLVCGGIFITFYVKPQHFRQKGDVL